MMPEPAISGDTTIAVSKDQVSVDITEEAIILHLKSGVYFGLDTVGAAIWNLIQEPITVNEIRDALLDEFNVEPERCDHDLLEFTKKLLKEGLIEVKSEKTA